VPGGRWCVTAANWFQAHRDGCADVVPLDALREHAVDVPDDLGNL
jgi:uncharacterized protein (DUF2237 family)